MANSAASHVRDKIADLRLWRSLYDADYIRHHFVVWNNDGEAEALIDEILRLRKKLRERGRLGKRG